MITFGLSRRQQKELSERGRPLRLLLPDDQAVPDDQIRAHVERVLDVPARWIKEIRPVEVTVNPPWRVRPDNGSAGDVLGKIIHDPIRDPGSGAITMLCLEVLVVPPRARHEPSRWEWPGRYVCNER